MAGSFLVKFFSAECLVQVMAWCRQASSHYLNQCWPRSMPPYGVTRPQWVNSSDAGDRIFQLWRSIPCLLMYWILRLPEHQQAWLCRTDNVYCCSRVDFIYLGQAQSEILFKMWIYIFCKQISMLIVNVFIMCNLIMRFVWVSVTRLCIDYVCGLGWYKL